MEIIKLFDTLLSLEVLSLDTLVGFGFVGGVLFYLYLKIRDRETFDNNLTEKINDLKVRITRIEDRLDRLMERK